MSRTSLTTTALKSTTVTIGILVGILVGLVWRTATAAPVSPSAATRAAVYDGVVAVVPGNAGDSILEIGAFGKDITSSGDIYLRSNSLSSANAIRIYRNLNTTNVYVPGKVCLNNGDCRDTWPSGAGGSGTWELVGNRLIPENRGYGVYVEGPAFPNQPLTVIGNHTDSVLFVSNTSVGANAKSLVSGYDAYIYGDLDVYSADPKAIEVFDFGSGIFGQVWHQDNDGIGSTLPGDFLDGFDLYTQSGPSCFFTPNCLCGQLPGSSGFPTQRCIDLYP